MAAGTMSPGGPFAGATTPASSWSAASRWRAGEPGEVGQQRRALIGERDLGQPLAVRRQRPGKPERLTERPALAP